MNSDLLTPLQVLDSPAKHEKSVKKRVGRITLYFYAKTLPQLSYKFRNLFLTMDYRDETEVLIFNSGQYVCNERLHMSQKESERKSTYIFVLRSAIQVCTFFSQHFYDKYYI